MYEIKKITSNTTVDFAAEELKKYLRMMMPNCGEIPIEYVPSAKTHFRIGLMSAFGLDTSDAEDINLDDIVYIDTDENGGIIAGSNPGATLIAVYRYLRACGCRWLFPGVDGEWIPIIGALPKVNYRKLADHRYRGQCIEGAEYQMNMLESIDFTPKIGMNSYMLQFDIPYYFYNIYYNHTNNNIRKPEPINRNTVIQWKRQCEVEIKKRGLHFHDVGHGWTAEAFGIDSARGWTAENEDCVPPENRKYLAMINGERKLFHGVPMNTNICMSNPEARRIMVNYVADYAERQNHVDVLNVWLADRCNNHCECDKCKKLNPSDWYVMLLNDIDEEFTRRSNDMHLSLCVYVDTFWAPIEKKLNNKERFTLNFAPISRLYTETYAIDADSTKLVPYERNNINRPRGMAESLAYLHEWQKTWSGDCYCYEYYFMDFQYMDISGMFLSKIIYEDIISLKKHGLKGIIDIGSQRRYFPNGFRAYLFGEALFDSSVSYDFLKEDYFKHAYGEKWKDVVEYLENLCELMDFSYFFGLKSVDTSKGKFYNPSMADNLKEAKKLAENFTSVINEIGSQEYRASAVMWQLLEEHLTVVKYVSDMLAYKSIGDDLNMLKIFDDFKRIMSVREIYIERYMDLWLFIFVLAIYEEGKRKDFAENLK